MIFLANVPCIITKPSGQVHQNLLISFLTNFVDRQTNKQMSINNHSFLVEIIKLKFQKCAGVEPMAILLSFVVRVGLVGLVVSKSHACYLLGGAG